MEKKKKKKTCLSILHCDTIFLLQQYIAEKKNNSSILDSPYAAFSYIVTQTTGSSLECAEDCGLMVYSYDIWQGVCSKVRFRTTYIIEQEMEFFSYTGPLHLGASPQNSDYPRTQV